MDILDELNKVAEELNAIEEPRVIERSRKRYEIVEVDAKYGVRDTKKNIMLTICKDKTDARRVIEILNHTRVR